MDGEKSAPVWEGLKLLTGTYLVYVTGGWFGAEKYHATIPYAVGTYMAAAMCLSISFSINRKG